MFLLGHLGIGSRLVSPWSKGLSRRWLLLGTVLPDFVDKPLYYFLSATHDWKTGQDLGLISSSRSITHSASFLLIVSGVAVWKRSKPLAALSLGIATHLLLDNVSDGMLGARGERSSAYMALLFPFLGPRFANSPFHNVREHANAMKNGVVFGAEIIGASLLAWDEWKLRNSSGILHRFRGLRLNLRKRRNS